MRISLFTRIFGGYLLVIALVSLLIPVLSFQAIKRNYTEMFTSSLKNLGISLAPQIADYLQKGKIGELGAYSKGLGEEIHTRITVVDPTGVVLADSEKDPRTMENHSGRPEVAEALRGSIGKSIRFSITVDDEMIYVALPIEKDGRLRGVLRMSAFLRDINRLLAHLQEKILQVALIITVIALLAALAISRGLSKPIKELVLAARNIAKGDFNSRITVTNQKELKELANSFNEMTVQIRDLFVHLNRQNEELGTIISSIQEVLLVLRKDGTIKLTNESFKKISNDPSPEGKFFWEVLRSPEFDDLVNRVKAEKRNISAEAELKDRVYFCSATLLASKEEIVTVCHDITDLKNLEQVKKDFVANISHELRTPLTAIKGFVETLEEEEQIENIRYLDIIKRHTGRLMNIVRDLLILSELEEKNLEAHFEEVFLNGTVSDMVKLFEQQAKQKGLSIEVDAERDDFVVRADPFKLEQMFINLIDNAIKYTDSGQVVISLREKGGNAEISVADTGAGISQEHLKRIFERFYVADKSRSKKLGGTGLGLSIVKHIVLLHGGTIDVESVPGKGTRFVVTLPMEGPAWVT